MRGHVRGLYYRLARSPGGEFHFHRGPAYAVERLRYDPAAWRSCPPRRQSAAHRAATRVSGGCYRLEIVKHFPSHWLKNEGTIMQDLTIVRAGDLRWQASPSPSVWRKRLFHQGPPESGTVTSIVRFESGSTFPRHGHPEGEEVLVLEGVYSDEGGSFPAGTYILRPEGFEHTPFSVEGCLLLVRLRQYAGLDREHVVIDTQAASWDTLIPGVRRQLLYGSARHTDFKWLIELQRGASLSRGDVPEGAEIVVVEGELEGEQGQYPRHTWLRLPRGSAHALRAATGCLLYVSTPAEDTA
jgi:hypothetical protein